MSTDRGTLHAVSWQEVFPGLRLLSALRMALNFRALVLAAIAIAGTSAGWRVCGRICADPEDAWLTNQIGINDLWPWEHALVQTPMDGLTTPEGWRQHSPLLAAWEQISQPFKQVFEARSFSHFAYFLVCAVWSLVVWSFFGGAISRLAAVSFARHENLSWNQLARFVRPRLGAYFAAPLFPILGTFLAAALMALLGLVARVGAGAVVAGLLWPLVLLGGFMAAFLLIGLFAGWPLMWGAISAEGTDSFGALSHSYSYAYQRPLHYLLYVVAAALVGVLGWYLVTLFAIWVIYLSQWGVSWGSGTAFFDAIALHEEKGMLETAGASLIEFWNNCVRTLAFGFIFSYFWSATTVIYFLLRRLVDATELDEVYLPEEHELHALPPLKTGPDGVPDVADEGALSGNDAAASPEP